MHYPSFQSSLLIILDLSDAYDQIPTEVRMDVGTLGNLIYINLDIGRVFAF
jgi:hypothetical protein